jgi:hypothetical protein
MRKLRLLKQGVWYGVRSCINNGEPLFRRCDVLALFAEVFHEAEARFDFVVRGLCLINDRLVFYLKPDDGFALPAIMKWLKQTFAARFNRLDGRTGHIWGDRYESWILEGEPSADAVEVASSVSVGGERLMGNGPQDRRNSRVRPHSGWKPKVRPYNEKPLGKAHFSPLFPHPTPPPPS